jgi:hypothetical protein
MSNKNLFKEAIADAKAVREAALANAKAALEEALTPKLQSMLAAKLNEMEYEMEEEGHMGEDEMEEGFTTSHGDDSEENLDFNLEEEMEDESMDEDFDLSEILAELEDEEMEEAKKKKLNKGGYHGPLKDKDEKTTVKTTKNDTAYSELSEAKDEEEMEDDEESEKVSEMSVEDLKALIKDIVSQEIEAEEAEGPGAEEEEDGEKMSMDMGREKPESDEIDLDELLAELDEMGKDDEMENEGLLDKIGAGLSKANFMMSDKVVNGQKVKVSKEEREADWKASGGDKEYLKKKGYFPTTPHKQGQAFGVKESEMNEAIRTINTLRNELNEVNLLNAKLLYVNKIFKAKNLSESQKLKVIASFDKATTAKEAKVVFESLNANLTAAAPKQAIKESLGFASRAAGVAPRQQQIVESNDAITRMQKLANIIK